MEENGDAVVLLVVCCLKGSDFENRRAHWHFSLYLLKTAS